MHLSKAINMDCGTLNRIENKKYNKINNSIIRLYDFYNNDFNKKIDKKEQKEDKTYYGKRKKIFEWYKNTDLKKLREKFGYPSQTELSKKIKISTSAISRIERKEYNTLNKTIMMLHKFYQDEKNNKNYVAEEIQPEPINVFDYYQVLDEPKTEIVVSTGNEKIDDLENIIAEKDKKIVELERQIMLYEKLIERL